MTSDNLALTVGVSIFGVAVLGGVGFGAYVLAKKSNQMPPGKSVPGVPGTGLPINQNVNAPVGPNADWNDILKEQAEHEKQLAEWRKRDKINQLEQKLSSAQNEIKRLTDQLNNIDTSPLPYDIKADVTQQRVTHCENSRQWFNFIWDCEQWRHLNGDDGKWQKIANQKHEEHKDRERRPLLVRLSELNDLQLNLIRNLGDLGVVKNPVRAA